MLIFLAFVLVAVLTAPWWINWNILRGPIASAVHAATGRTLVIADLDVDPGWTTEVRINGVQLSNAEWASPEQMLVLERARFQVRLLPLLWTSVQLPLVEVERLRAELLKDEEGRANWLFEKSEDASDDDTPSRSDIPALEQISLKDIRVHYRDASRPFDYEVVVDELGASGGGGQALEAAGSGRLQGQPFQLSVNGDSFEALRSGDAPYPLTLEFLAGESGLWLNGSVDKPQTFEGLNIDMRIKGPNLGEWYEYASIPLPETPPYELAGRLRHRNAEWRFEDFQGQLGDSDLRGDFAVDVGGERMQVSADLTSRKLDFDDLGPLIGVPPDENETASAEQQDEAEEAATDERVIPDKTLPLGKLRVADATVTLSAERVLAPGLPIDNLQLDVDLQNGLLRVSPFALGFAGGSVNSYATIDATVDPATWDFDIRARDFKLSELLRSVDLKDAGSGLLSGDIKIKGRGENLREAAAASDGRLTMVVSGGRFSGLLMELIGLDVAESLGMLIGGSEQVDIRCLVADLDVDEGDVESRSLLLDTSDTRVNGKLTADLEAERFKLRLSPEPKDPSLFSARTPFEIDGRFSDVNVAPDFGVLGLRLGAAAALGALAPPAALLAFLEPGPASDAQCEELLGAAQREGDD